MQKAGLILALSLFLAATIRAEGPAASEGHVDAKPVDPTQATTLEAQEAKEEAKEGKGLSLKGVGYLSYVAPFDAMGGFNLLLLQAELRYDWARWGLYATPRIKINDPGQEDADSYIYVQQAFAFWRHNYGEIKLGKVYARFGRFWDYGFYGPLVANNDLKLTPDMGISAEGAPELAKDWFFEYALQYYAFDGHAWSLANASPFSFNRVRRTNIVVARVAPAWHISPLWRIALGASGGRFDAAFSDNHQVIRGAFDADVQVGPVAAFVEVGKQNGTDVVLVSNLEVPGFSYVWTGIQVELDRVSVRYHYNGIRYIDDTVEALHQPGIQVKIADFFTLMGEFALWNTSQPISGRGEKSFYLIAMGSI